MNRRYNNTQSVGVSFFLGEEVVDDFKVCRQFDNFAVECNYEFAYELMGTIYSTQVEWIRHHVAYCDVRVSKGLVK